MTTTGGGDGKRRGFDGKQKTQNQQQQQQSQAKRTQGTNGEGGAGGDFLAVVPTDVTMSPTAAPVAPSRKEKPSRRTTSLLNIFMSNSQGKG